jgi:hypothetical protein
MFDRVSQAAERLATDVSRRAFLSRLGQGALAAAAVLGAMLAFPRAASAGDCPPGTQKSLCPNGHKICCPSGQKCYFNGRLGGNVCAI